MHDMEEDRTPVGRLDFKSGEGRTTSLVGSTPTLFRHPQNRGQIIVSANISKKRDLTPV